MHCIYTLGVSNRTWDAFVALLQAHDVSLVADVRAQPGSRRVPHFASAALAAALPATGVAYRWFPRLGGRRVLQPGSDRNVGWREDALRAYADYMGTPAFAAALAQLEEAARERRAAILCAEAQYTRCHRQLVADALLARGWQVLHVGGESIPLPHTLTPFAQIDSASVVTYPGEPRLDLDVVR